jgi:hypothetical protein
MVVFGMFVVEKPAQQPPLPVTVGAIPPPGSQ